MLWTQRCIYMIRDQRWKYAKTWLEHVFGSYSKTEHIYHLSNKNNIMENYETHQILCGPT